MSVCINENCWLDLIFWLGIITLLFILARAIHQNNQENQPRALQTQIKGVPDAL